MLLVVSQTNPEANKERESSRGGALTNAQAGGGSANAQVVLPQHRATVERFFARKDNADKKN